MKHLLLILLFSTVFLNASGQVWAGSDIYVTNIHGMDSNSNLTGYVNIDCIVLPGGDTVCGGIDSISLNGNMLCLYRDSADPLCVTLSGLSDTPTLAQVLAKGNTANRGIHIDTLFFDGNYIVENTPEASVEIWDNDQTGMISFSPQDGHIDIKAPGSENGNLVATNFTAPRSWVFPDLSGTIALSEHIPIPTLWQVDGVIDFKRNFNPDSLGLVSASSKFRQAFATDRAIYLGEGDYLIDSTVNVPDSAVIYGEGWKTRIRVANNVKAFSVGSFARIENITFIGTRGTGGTTSQTAISLDTSRGQLIRGCNFYKIAGSAIKITQTNVTTFQGSQIQNCYSDSCYIGVFVANRGEYGGISNSTFINGRYGAYIKGGNTSFSLTKFTGNFYGIYINGNEDGNEAHSSITGATSNHNTHNVYVDSIRFGHLFTGCDFYYGGISVRNSNGVRVNGCDIGFQGSVDTFAVVNSTNTSFDNISFYNAQEPLRISDGSAFPISTYSGVTKSYYNLNNDSVSTKLRAWGGIEAKGGILQQFGSSTLSLRNIISGQYSNTTHGAMINGIKSRGTILSPLVISSGDTLLNLVGWGYDGANWVRAGGIHLRNTGTVGTNRIGSEMAFLTATNASPSVPTVAMTIDNTQNVFLTNKLSVGTTVAPNKAINVGLHTDDGNTVLIQPTTNTRAGFFQIANLGGTHIFSADNSTGSNYGNGPYSLGMFTSGNNNIGFSTNGILRVIISRTGKAIFRDSLVALQTPVSTSTNDSIAVLDATTKLLRTIAQPLAGSATLDFPSTNAQLSADLTITVTGASVGDVVAVGAPAADANSSYTAWVSATNTVTVRFNNYSAGAINPASGTFKVKVLR